VANTAKIWDYLMLWMKGGYDVDKLGGVIK